MAVCGSTLECFENFKCIPMGIPHAIERNGMHEMFVTSSLYIVISEIIEVVVNCNYNFIVITQNACIAYITHTTAYPPTNCHMMTATTLNTMYITIEDILFSL